MSVCNQMRIHHLICLSLININHDIKNGYERRKTGARFLCAKSNLKQAHRSLTEQQRSHNNRRERLRKGHIKTSIGESKHLTSVHQRVTQLQLLVTYTLGISAHRLKMARQNIRDRILCRHRIASELHSRNDGSSKVKRNPWTSQHRKNKEQSISEKTNSPTGSQLILEPQRWNSISVRPSIKVKALSEKRKARYFFKTESGFSERR